MQTKLTLPLIGMSSKDSALATTPGGTGGGEGELTAADPISQAEIVSSQTITSRSRTVETTTYSLQVGYHHNGRKILLLCASVPKRYSFVTDIEIFQYTIVQCMKADKLAKIPRTFISVFFQKLIKRVFNPLFYWL